MDESFNLIIKIFKAKRIEEIEVIQPLWSGYGKISRLALIGSDTSSVIVKNVKLPSQIKHPRGWNTDHSHQRKLKSYEVEQEWYLNWASRCNNHCRVPIHYFSQRRGKEQLLVLEDLDAVGFPIRKSSLTENGVKLGLGWLANFHATFMNELPTNLWKQGTYWHLNTRLDEFDAMENSKLKDIAVRLDKVLESCNFKTIVHGDAKVANFCFSHDMKQISAVDFQYVGGGCGMKDVVYFLGSCLKGEDCERLETELLDHYFQELKVALKRKNKIVSFRTLEKEWRLMYIIAWADFIRFLKGWMPEHHKINDYSEKLVFRASKLIEETLY